MQSKALTQSPTGCQASCVALGLGASNFLSTQFQDQQTGQLWLEQTQISAAVDLDLQVTFCQSQISCQALRGVSLLVKMQTRRR